MLLSLAEYHRLATIEEALALLRRPGVKTAALAGGTELNGRNDDTIRAVVDLRLLPLDRVRVVENEYRTGAMVTLQRLATPAEGSGEAGRLLALAARREAPRTLRVAATLGGTLAVADPYSPLIAAWLALGARVRLYTREETYMDVDEFLMQREELLAAGALIHGVRTPLLAGGSGYAQAARTPSDRPLLAAAAILEVAEGRVRRAQLAFAGTLDGHSCAGLALEGREASVPLFERAAHGAAQAVTFRSDFRAGAAYRQEVAGVLARRALMEAYERCTSG